MADMKRTLKINFWKIMLILGFIMWLLLMWLDPIHLSSESPFTGKWFIRGLIIIICIFSMSVFMWISQIRSPKTVHCQGSDTWDPSEWLEIPAEVQNGKIMCPSILIRGVGGFKAMGVYMHGKGDKGFDVIVNLPGIWFRRGANLVLNTDVRETYIGEYEHQEIANIIEKINTYILGMPGMISIAHDTPIYVYTIPAEYPGIPENVLEFFGQIHEIEKHFSTRLAKQKATILDLQMTIGKLRGANNSASAFQTALRPKGVENDGIAPPPTQ